LGYVVGMAACACPAVFYDCGTAGSAGEQYFFIVISKGYSINRMLEINPLLTAFFYSCFAIGIFVAKTKNCFR
jgi:hypothetical protein